ncbi:leucine-rich repeat domain-containing protein [Flavobacteriales bacterium]|nr:leucine-rich repeat domain-containing protein [Flavobacteriales bacterium]
MRNQLFSFMFFLGLVTNGYSQVLSDEELDTCYIYKTIEKASKTPEAVYVLDLTKSKLKAFPDEILNFKNLNILKLGKNKIASVPEGISKLIFLQELDLGKNKLDGFPGGIVELVNLKQLVLNQNYIEGIPYMIKNLQKLEYLDMWSNNLSSFPESLNELKNLKEFDLRVIQFTKSEKERITKLLPNAKIHFSASCNCGS